MSQQDLGIEAKTTSSTVGEYKFEPIKGYPMLNWKGKRPFTATQFYPAQKKEIYGGDVEGWINKIFWGDNLQVMSHLLKMYRGKINLIYIDPPFDSRVDYKKKIELKGEEALNDRTSFEEKQYSDIWSNDEYLQFMYERLIIARELLSDNGSIYLHCDWHKSHLLRCIMDEIFGSENFRNEVIWKRGTVKGAKAKGNQFARNHDVIYYYTKSSEYFFERQFIPFSEEYKRRFAKDDNDGKGPYRDDQAIGTRSKESIAQMIIEGKIVVQPDGSMKIKTYLNELNGVVVDDDWIDVDDDWVDISEVNVMSNDRTNYPTQKPEKLLERIINASSKKGDIVFDCFMGSGTTQAVAMKLGRRFIGADINLGAIQTTTKRLISVSQELSQRTLDENDIKYTGFEICNVNHYDVFRNPVEAKELLLDALEIQKLEMSSVYDGEKDGRMVKIMPVNRIVTRADLSELVNGFDYKAFERRQSEKPNQPVEKILIVCMGHEPDLQAHLQKEVSFKLDVEIVDILRDKSNLEFKRDSEALIAIKADSLAIEKFYPMNLLQKLSLQKESVSDWKELVESVMIDWNYDGAILQPSIVDIPGKNEFVTGSYKVPADAGTIRVKITDLLSESLEVELANG